MLAETGLDSLTGLRILKALPHIEGDTFLATYGDAVADVDLDALIETHKRMGRLATVTAVHPSSRFGELAIDGGMITSFAEKPQVTQGWINGGYFVFNRRAFDLLDPDLNEPLETGLLERLASMGELAVHQHSGFWQCMDTYREMQLLNDMWQKGQGALAGLELKACGDTLSTGFLEQPPRLRHRSHRLQGRLADGTLRAGSGRRRADYALAPAVASRASSRWRASPISARLPSATFAIDEPAHKRDARGAARDRVSSCGAGARQAGARATLSRHSRPMSWARLRCSKPYATRHRVKAVRRRDERQGLRQRRVGLGLP